VRSEHSETFQGTHILGASRGLLCDSSAVLFDFRVNIDTRTLRTSRPINFAGTGTLKIYLSRPTIRG